MTDSEPHHPKSDDAQASLRAQLLGQLSASQFAIEAALAELANADPAVRVQLRSQLGQIAGLCQQIGTAPGVALAALRTEAAMLAGSTSAAVQEARANATAGSSSAIGMAMYANASREQVNAVMAGMTDFDRYLQFGPDDSEADYRKREEERRAYIAAQQAKHTPQGDLNASGAAVGQMADAAAHGATDSPEFQKRWDALVASTEKLRAQIIRDGGDVAEFDNRLREDLRRIMKSKGLSDAQINALFTANPDNPLDAAKAFVAEQKGAISEKDIDGLLRETQPVKAAVSDERASVAAAPSMPTAIPASALDAMADLKAAGVIVGDHEAGNSPKHGVTVAVASNPGQSVSART